MTKHWQELLPVDRYTVSAAGMIHDYDRKILTMLYQPLIGPVCISLYITLWSELEENRLWSNSSLHYGLMNTMAINLREIYDARIKLEGLGLLKVFKKKDNDETEFIYELHPPLSPEQFFTDGMLNVYLFKKVGKVHFGRLKKFFCDETISIDEYSEVTKPFPEVFSSEHLESLYTTDEAQSHFAADTGQKFIGKTGDAELTGFEPFFDFKLLFSGLNNSLVPQKAFTAKAKDTIAKLAFLYGIDALQMQNLILRAVDGENEIDLEELRKAARDWYQIEHYENLPSLSDRVQPAIYLTQTAEPKTKEEQLIRHLETVSPRQRLIQVSGGAEPSKNDLQIIEDIMMNQNLPPGVINVLIEYVMLKSDMKLSKGYVEKIAGHWARKKIVTVKQAMELAKKEHRQYQEWQDGKGSNKQSGKKPIRTEQVPEWLKNEHNPVPEQKGQKDSRELEEQKKQMLERLKKLNNKG
ncbi:Replication initiation and membrane attachment protein [Peribacillus saganii]|uniref:Replication initiation and membrane attachment protein n=1 Tax=Peribacillus saganii TaxID=2303992 RepID=A0A372LSE8_9BACI|nr:replication initiation and membrane attachment family protein [Peribacillus saganii]RFU70722.1 Replication initiation and membrane attachment protein [Peribacillus saganii]